jgi:phage terminase large subunit-like protein
MLMLGLRLGTDPRCAIATTPRPTVVIRDLVASRTTHVTRGSTYDNRANLAPAFFEQIISRYEGTRLGRQEINAEILEDVPGALWNRQMLDDCRVTQAPQLTRIIVAVDPEATATETSAETGIIVAGLGIDKHGYILDDRTLKGSPHAWASQAVAAYHSRQCDRIVYEANQGHDMVAHTLHSVDPNVPLTGVNASRAKQARAEPIEAFYEQGRVHHVGAFVELEDQLCNWTPNSGQASPDRLDALVWALTDLMLGAQTWVREPLSRRQELRQR